MLTEIRGLNTSFAISHFEGNDAPIRGVSLFAVSVFVNRRRYTTRYTPKFVCLVIIYVDVTLAPTDISFLSLFFS